MKKVTDYIGNEIKEGDEVCLIKIFDRQHFRYAGYIMDGELKGTPEPERPGIPCWEKWKYMKVHKSEEGGGYLYIIEEGENYTAHHSIETLMAFTESNIILAIKDVSDKEELYIKYLDLK